MQNHSYIYRKNSKAQILVMIIVLLMGSCERALDLHPYSSISDASAFSTPDLVENSVLGMYQAAQGTDYTGGARGYPFGAAFVQQGDIRGEEVVSIYVFYLVTYMSLIDEYQRDNSLYWISCYRLINRCNVVIEGVRTATADGVITESVASVYEGEARMLRAMAHHELLMHFARPYRHTGDASHWGVPYREIPYNSTSSVENGISQGRNSVAECYSKILEDLDFAETVLPDKSERIGNWQITRLTSGAAIAWKVRVYQHMWDMENVILEGEKLVASGEYWLTQDPSGPFLNNYSNSESIFSIENSAANNPGPNGALASMYNRRKLICVSPIIWRNPFWLTDDMRRHENEMIVDESGVKYINKYKDIIGNTDGSPVIRYAEVILNLAEAYARRNQAGDFDKALSCLNLVRDRALADPSTQSYRTADFNDNVELLEAILGERAIEFVCEGRRWPDIHRLQHCPYFPVNGIPAKLANDLPDSSYYILGTPYNGPLGVEAIPYSDKRFLWPIPQDELAVNPTLREQQNPGW